LYLDTRFSLEMQFSSYFVVAVSVYKILLYLDSFIRVLPLDDFLLLRKAGVEPTSRAPKACFLLLLESKIVNLSVPRRILTCLIKSQMFMVAVSV